MAFYIVVHHPSDPNKLWANEWEAQTLLRSITTPSDIAVRLAQAKAKGERVYIHRCAWSSFPAEICCSALVSEVQDLDKSTAFVRFDDVQPVGDPPSVAPRIGQSSYDAKSPSNNVMHRTAQ
jgi:hypothetical protein